MNNKENTPSDTKETEQPGFEPPSQMALRIGSTTYRVNVHFSETSKETITDKILRLIRNEKLI